jgi:hypothetical protein
MPTSAETPPTSLTAASTHSSLGVSLQSFDIVSIADGIWIEAL